MVIGLYLNMTNKIIIRNDNINDHPSKGYLYGITILKIFSIFPLN